MTNTSKAPNIKHIVVGYVIVIALLLGSVLLNGWFIAIIWNRVMPTLFPVGKLTTGTALGLELLIILLVSPAIAIGRPFTKRKKKVDSNKDNTDNNNNLGPHAIE